MLDSLDEERTVPQSYTALQLVLKIAHRGIQQRDEDEWQTHFASHQPSIFRSAKTATRLRDFFALFDSTKGKLAAVPPLSGDFFCLASLRVSLPFSSFHLLTISCTSLCSLFPADVFLGVQPSCTRRSGCRPPWTWLSLPCTGREIQSWTPTRAASCSTQERQAWEFRNISQEDRDVFLAPRCNCKKGCQNGVCSCRKAERACSGVCGCVFFLLSTVVATRKKGKTAPQLLQVRVLQCGDARHVRSRRGKLRACTSGARGRYAPRK